MEGSDSHQLVTPPPPAFSSQAAANELNTTAAGIFRGNFVGALDGPYISQFFRQPVPSVYTIVQQRYRSGARGIGYLTTYDEWQVIQTGVPPFRAWIADPQERYIYNGRSLAEWVHYSTPPIPPVTPQSREPVP